MTRSTRLHSFALLLGALLLAPPPVPAAPGGCRLPANESGMIGDIRTVISAEAAQQSPVTLRLTFRMQASGAVRGAGEIRSGIGSSITTATGPLVPELVAARQTVGAVCADLDGDGVAGLRSLSLDFREPTNGDVIPIVLQTPGADIDASGVYAVVLQVGSETASSDVRVRLTRERDRRHRRR